MGGGGVTTATPNKNQPNAGGVRPNFALFLMQGDAELVLTAMKQLREVLKNQSLLKN